jgi:hypothetical protein
MDVGQKAELPADKKHNGETKRDDEKPMTKGERLMLWFNGILAVTAILGTVIITYQLALTRQQIKASDAAAEQAKNDTKRALDGLADLTKANKTIADAAKVSADAAQASSASATRLVSSAESANSQARSLFEMDQRARIAITGGKSGKYLPSKVTHAHAGLVYLSSVHIDIAFSNVGKSPATRRHALRGKRLRDARR